MIPPGAAINTEKLRRKQHENLTKEELVSLFMEMQDLVIKSAEQHETMQHQLEEANAIIFKAEFV